MDFDPQKEAGNFFGREIPEERKLRDDFASQQARFQQQKRQVDNDVEDDFDAMFLEELERKGQETQKQKNLTSMKSVEEERAELMQKAQVIKSESEGIESLLENDQVLPQDIKDKVTEIELDHKEKLRQTMLQQPSKKKTTALKNLQAMFEDYPVVTNES